MRKVRMDIAGQRFGRLIVDSYAFTNKHGKSMWNCQCDCGKAVVVAGAHLKSGHTASCGCYGAEASGIRTRTHGMRQTRLYRIWLGMKSRCTIPSVKCYKHYGGRGITICDSWMNDYQAFHDWAMASGYRDGLTIDRIDVDGNYCPENCKWATWKEQHRNTRKTVYIEMNGKRMPIADWADETGINLRTLYTRYYAGKTPEQILAKGC